MYVSEEKFDFLMRWKEKGESYNLDDLSDCFDAFFSAYVPFNFIYDFLAHNSPPIKDKKNIPVKVPRIFLGSKAIASDSEIKSNATIIQDLGARGLLNLEHFRWDERQLNKLSSNDPEQYSSGVLEILYKVRCNMFHGEKPVKESQKQILIPCVKIMRRLNDLMTEKLQMNQAG